LAPSVSHESSEEVMSTKSLALLIDVLIGIAVKKQLAIGSKNEYPKLPKFLHN
jgi:hypothetical protein